MKNAIKQYNFIKKGKVSIRYSSLFKGVEFGSPNGSNDLKRRDLRVLKIRAVSQNESGEKLPSIWLKRFFPLERSWKLTRPDVLPSLALELRSSTGSSSKGRLEISPPSLPLLKFSLVMEGQEELRPKEIAISNLILISRQRRLETFIRQTLWDPDISEVQKGLPDSIPFILWMWQGIQFPPASFPTNRPSPFVSISSKHGNIWGFPEYLRWITRWQLLVEDATPTVSPSLSDFICLWEYIWYSSHRESQVETPLLKVLMTSGKRESLEDITVLPLVLLKELMSDSCGITIMRNRIEGLPKKNTAQDCPVYSEIASGNLLDTCPTDLALKNILIPMGILASLSQREGPLLLEKLILMVKLRLTALLISLREDLRGSMLLPLSLLIERDWLLNKTIGLSNLSLSRLRVILLFPYSQLQGGKLNLVSDVMIFLSIKIQLAML
ncbi:MAG: hypothetical protein NT055_00695 [Nitrospirae bacterium]|nr:hypothetical protein [Nitrospirota bacterium]